jgi:hypothetical protein
LSRQAIFQHAGYGIVGRAPRPNTHPTRRLTKLTL